MTRKTGGEEERKTQFHSSKFFIHWQIYFTNIIVVVVFSKFKWKYMLYVRQWATWEDNLWIFSISKQYMLTFKWKKKEEKEEINFVKTTSLLTLEEHFSSGFTREYFRKEIYESTLLQAYIKIS